MDDQSQGSIIRILAPRSTQPKTGRPPPIRGKIHRKNIGRDLVELVRKNAMMMLMMPMAKLIRNRAS